MGARGGYHRWPFGQWRTCLCGSFEGFRARTLLFWLTRAHFFDLSRLCCGRTLASVRVLRRGEEGTLVFVVTKKWRTGTMMMTARFGNKS
jgi:hypothetical protein